MLQGVWNWLKVFDLCCGCRLFEELSHLDGIGGPDARARLAYPNALENSQALPSKLGPIESERLDELTHLPWRVELAWEQEEAPKACAWPGDLCRRGDLLGHEVQGVAGPRVVHEPE